MAKYVDRRRCEIAHRLHDFACNRYGLPESDLMIDPLTFTIATGNEDDRKLGLWTLDGIERIRAEDARTCRSSSASPTSPSA